MDPNSYLYTSRKTPHIAQLCGSTGLTWTIKLVPHLCSEMTWIIFSRTIVLPLHCKYIHCNFYTFYVCQNCRNILERFLEQKNETQIRFFRFPLFWIKTLHKCLRTCHKTKKLSRYKTPALIVCKLSFDNISCP